ncbi:MAG TPA: OmpA family protein [Acetobacteraceae bacterium]|nr:OmpA family protein [Acetobacteraceae bacterium]
MRKSWGLVAGAALLATTGVASAQPTQGLYVGAGIGVSWLLETNQAIHPPLGTVLATPSDHFRRRWEPGPYGVVSLGWGFGNGFRAEIEGAYRQNEEGGGSLLFSRRSSGGHARSIGIFVNALYDFHVSPWVVPYVGLGAGYAWNRWSGVGGTVPPFGLSVNDSKGSFAYQGIVGLGFPIAAVPGLTLGAEYRYIGTPQPDFDGVLTGPGIATAVRVRPATHSHNLLFTVRYNFGQAPRVVAVQPAQPGPARSFLVFFDFDRADLTPRAREIIAQAAQASRSQQTTRIEVAGHADRSGTPQYNQGLSQRRANNVAAELVRNGVPRGAISVAAFGESRPLVPTADGVREPQNRRVEIVLR